MLRGGKLLFRFVPNCPQALGTVDQQSSLLKICVCQTSVTKYKASNKRHTYTYTKARIKENVTATTDANIWLRLKSVQEKLHSYAKGMPEED